jgi:hypothetical protein
LIRKETVDFRHTKVYPVSVYPIFGDTHDGTGFLMGLGIVLILLGERMRKES